MCILSLKIHCVNQLHWLLNRFSWTENILLINAAGRLCVSVYVCVFILVSCISLCKSEKCKFDFFLCEFVCTCGAFAFDPLLRQDVQTDRQNLCISCSTGICLICLLIAHQLAFPAEKMENCLISQGERSAEIGHERECRYSRLRQG